MNRPKFSIIIFPILLSSCATMFNNGTQSFRVMAKSDKKVNVTITTPDGTYDAKLPTTIVTSPSTFSKVKVTVNDKCYRPTTTLVKESITLSYWANLLNGYGFLIDPLTGAMWKYSAQTLIHTSKKKC